MDNQDKTTFSLDDEEIVEEEVIDRDEEYDDGYDDEYDEEYDDDGYDDEEYDDGYDDEEYDDGYSDDYYDDRLNKVLDEIAELKRGMVPATVQQQPPQAPPPIMPQYIYQPSMPSAGSEVVMYNEISRLRDELAKNQSSLEMQKELTRIKEDMARDQRFAEAQYNAEIQRLQSKIDELLKNADGPQGDSSTYDDSTHVEGGNSLNLDKLLSINEVILRSMRDSDARIQNEIAQLKKQFEEIPSLKELNGAVSAVKKALNGAESVNPEAIAKLTADISALKTALDEKGGFAVASAPAQISGSNNSVGDISTGELLRQLYEIKDILGASSDAAVKRTQVLSDLACEYKKVTLDVQSQKVQYKDKLTAVYGYAKKLSACGEQDAVDFIIATNKLLAELGQQTLTRAVFGDVVSFCSENGIVSVTQAMRDSADKYFGICEKLAKAPVSGYGEHLAELTAQLNILENNSRQAKNSEIVSQIVNAISAESPDEAAVRELLATLTCLKVSDIIELPINEIPADYDPAQAADTESIFARLEALHAAILDSAAAAAASNVAAAEESSEAVVAQTEEAPRDNEAVNKLAQAIDELKAKIEETASEPADTTDISGVLEEIRNNYVDVTDKLVDISRDLQHISNSTVVTESGTVVSGGGMNNEEIRQTLDNLEYIHNKLDEYDEFIRGMDGLKADIESRTSDLSAQIVDRYDSVITEITSQFDKLYEDLSNVVLETETSILGKVGEGLATNEAIESAKNDIISETQSLKDAINGVSDVVYTLPNNEIIESVRSDVIAETQSLKDAVNGVADVVYTLPNNEVIESVRADVIAETQSLKDTLFILSDQLTELQNNAYADVIEQIRADVANLAEITAANDETATADRLKLVDDIAFLREQAELALAEDEEIPDGATAVQDNEKLIGYLDEIAARVAQISALADDASATRESVTALGDNVAVVTDSVALVSDTVSAINDTLASANDGITAISEAVNATNADVTQLNNTLAAAGDNIAAARDAATATLDALTPIAEQLNSIIDRLDAQQAAYDAEETDGAAEADAYADSAPIMSDEELVELKESLNAILDTLPLFPQADDVVAARDNTFSILDTLVAMPQADDVVTTRDNVAAILDAVNTLTDSVTAALTAQTEGSDIETQISSLRESVEAVGDSIEAVRQKLDESRSEEQVEDLANIMQDLGLVLDKIEEYENTATANKQEIIDAVTSIREEIHINSLDETMSAAGIDDETRDALVGEIADIRERLGNIESVAQGFADFNNAIDGINAQLVDIQSALEDRIADSAVEQENVGLSNENMQAIFDELTGIKDKLSVQSEYDTVEEILSLREDIKASRIVDQDEVTSELEAIKNELAYISSGNIVDEIRALREDITGLPVGESGAAPTDGEVNLVLNEIVSLRDELFAFKDEVLNATAALGNSVEEDVAQPQESNEDITTILDELTALRADQSVLGENLDELKDIVSRRTNIGAADSVSDGEPAMSASELNVVLDEIINLKNDVDRIADSIADDKFAAMSEQVDEIRAIIDELRIGAEPVATEVAEQQVAVDLSPVMEQLETVNAALDELRLNVGYNEGSVDVTEQSANVDLSPVMAQLETVNAALDDLRINRDASIVTDDGGVPQTFADMFDTLREEIEEIKSNIADIAAPIDYAAELSELRAEIDALRAENEALKVESTDAVGAQIAELKDLIRESLAMSAAPQTTSDGDTSYAALIEEIRDLKDQIAVEQYKPSVALDERDLQAIRDAVSSGTVAAPDQGLGAELAEIRDEIAQLRSLTTVSADNSGSIAEVAAIRDELAELKNMLSSQDNLYGVAEDVTKIRADVQTLRDEPDLGVMSEILALRDEFQALREEIEDVKRIAGETDKESDDTLMSEVQSLRDQLFAISMANVNDPSSGESNYESYNNIILDELAAIRDQVSVAGSTSDLASNDIATMMEELEALREAVESRDEMLDSMVERVARASNSAANDKIMQELSSLRGDLANQRDADMATLNFMSEMAHLLERQNQYFAENENSGTKLSDEIESLKAEIASSDAVAEEVAKLRELMTQSGNAPDNDTILNELAELREELSREKPSRENDIVLDAIARLRSEITALADREQVRDIEPDAGLADSLTDLKNELTKIADIVDPEPKTAEPVEKKPTSKRGRKPGSKNTSSSSKKKSAAGAKRGRKPKNASSSAPTATTPIDDIEARIADSVADLSGDDDLSLNINDIATGDAMDIADRLAKQVANKLVMEQLVEQLGDGGVSEERVDEILRDILPHEFNTIAETEASDKVRRLANSLVLDKLRARLNGKKSDD